MLIDANADKTVRNNYGATPRETVMAPFSEMKPVYEMMQQMLDNPAIQDMMKRGAAEGNPMPAMPAY